MLCCAHKSMCSTDGSQSHPQTQPIKLRKRLKKSCTVTSTYEFFRSCTFFCGCICVRIQNDNALLLGRPQRQSPKEAKISGCSHHLVITDSEANICSHGKKWAYMWVFYGRTFLLVMPWLLSCPYSPRPLLCSVFYPSGNPAMTVLDIKNTERMEGAENQVNNRWQCDFTVDRVYILCAKGQPLW